MCDKILANEDYEFVVFEGRNNKRVNINSIKIEDKTIMTYFIQVIKKNTDEYTGYASISVTPEGVLYIDEIRRFNEESFGIGRRDQLSGYITAVGEKGLGKTILYILACLAQKIGCHTIHFVAYSGFNYTRVVKDGNQDRLESYYNSLGFRKVAPSTNTHGAEYLTPVSELIETLDLLGPNISNIEALTRHEPRIGGRRRTVKRRPKRKTRKTRANVHQFLAKP